MKDWKFHCAQLGVPENASAKEVRRAYRRLALLRHPDKHNNSQKSKEDFQQLNESYRYLLDGIAEGTRSQPRPASPEPARTSAAFHAPAPRRPTVPTRARPGLHREPFYWKVWALGTGACALVLAISAAIELAHSPLHERGSEQREHFLKAWCLIAQPDSAEGKPEAYEQWSERVCQERCASAAKGKNVACSWNGVEFHAARISPSKATMASEASTEDTVCEISIERSEGAAVPSAYHRMPERSCVAVCRERVDSLPRAGIRCAWKSQEFFRQALRKPDNTPTFMQEDTAKAMALIAGTATSQPQTTCYISIVEPGKIQPLEIPDATMASCEERCNSEVFKHRIDGEITCSFAGRRFVHHVPDPMEAYLARNPAQSIEQGNASLALCEIQAAGPGAVYPLLSAVTYKVNCESECRSIFRRSPPGPVITCRYKGETYFQKVAK